MAQTEFTIIVEVIDTWIGMDAEWNYIAYMLCDIAGKVYLVEKEL
jgi:hypothetical protein